MSTPFEKTEMDAEAEAVLAYAIMMNTGEVEPFLALLADDFRYISQNVLTDLVGVPAFADYITGKIESMRNHGLSPLVDIGVLLAYQHCNCAILWQGNPPVRRCVAYASVAGDRIKTIELCVIPPPEKAIAANIWPGLPRHRLDELPVGERGVRK